jgi:FAD synthetase
MEKLGQAIDGHGLEELAISYNGGKDCLVMLILLLAVIHEKFSSSNIDNSSLPYNFKLDSIYINSEDQFPQLTDFIAESTNYYHLNSIMIKCSLKKGFEHYLQQINTNIRAIIVGIRYSDPYGSQLKYEQTTDHNWPDFLRIHPILHWTYAEIWDFLVGTNLDYCEMYDLGYTSLGGISNTAPNPYLKVEGKEEYLPAYMLTEKADERERLGRTKK